MKEDMKFVEELCQGPLEMEDYKQDKIKKIFRLGIVLDTIETKGSILASAKKLKYAEELFKNISIQHDLTKLQREE